MVEQETIFGEWVPYEEAAAGVVTEPRLFELPPVERDADPT